MSQQGEWLRSGRTVYELNEQGFNRWSAHVQDPHTPEAELEDVARLIAAAPLMYEALKDTLRILKAVRYTAGLGKKQVARIEAAEAVLAKMQS